MAPAASFASLPSCLSFFYPYHRGSNYFLYLFFLPASLSLSLLSLFPPSFSWLPSSFGIAERRDRGYDSWIVARFFLLFLLFFSQTILSSVTLTSGFNSFCPKAGYGVCLSRAVTWSDLLFQNIPLELHLMIRSVFLLVFLSPPLFAFTRCFEFGYYFNKIENFEFRQRR